jgi:hypothetical protein
MDVAEGDDVLVFVEDVGGNLAPDDLAEDGVAHVALPSR